MYALTHHEGVLRASLQAVYGIRLDRHDLSVTELADYTAHLPAGCVFWQEVGGPQAWSPEMHMLNLIEFQSRVANWRQTQDAKSGRNKPKLQTPPQYAFEKAAEQSRQSDRAERWAQRQALRAET